MSDRPKDSYRWRMEEAITSPEVVAVDEKISLTDAIKLSKRIQKTKWFQDNVQKTSQGHPLIGEPFYRQSHSYYEVCEWDGMFRFNKGEQTVLHILHWLAHFTADHKAPEATRHGAHFVKDYLYLVNRFMGAEVKKVVRAKFLELKIKTKVVSAEARADARTRFQERRVAANRAKSLERAKRLGT